MADLTLIVSTNQHQVQLALLDKGVLVEYHTQDNENHFSVGDIFLGKIKKITVGLNACFVDVGHPKDAFLHYQDLGPKILSFNKYVQRTLKGKMVHPSLKDFEFEKDTLKEGRIDEIVTNQQQTLVQITKEPISSKGPRLTTEISLAGRYLVYLPLSKKIFVSKKISSEEEKKRLKQTVQKLLPKGFGAIIRTVAEGRTLEELAEDLDALNHKWKKLHRNLKRAKAPSKVFSEMNKAKLLLRDIFTDDFSKIIVDEEKTYQEILEYILQIAPEKKSIVTLDKGVTPVFERHHVTRQIKSAFGRTVPMTKGIYLVIEHTEALHVIDVNSGIRAVKKDTQQENALEVNKLAATEIARQLRLRDMGGIIVVDFIDMSDPESRKELFEHLRDAMASDKAKHKLLPPSKFGLIQITRQRVRPEKDLKISEPDPSNSTKQVAPPIQVVEEIQSILEGHLMYKTAKDIVLNVHPFIHAYLTKGIFSIRYKWFLKHKKWIKIIPRESYQFLEYQFTDKKQKKI